MTIKDLEDRVEAGQGIGTFKLNITHDGQNEGIWACFVTPKDKAIYDKNTSGDKINVYLMNHALISGPTWGAKLTVKTRGSLRPVITVQELIKQMNKAAEAGEYPPMEAFKS